MDSADLALLELLAVLKKRAYRFVTPSPATHARFLARQPRFATARTVAEVLGWSMRFLPEFLPRDILQLLDQAGGLEQQDGSLKSRLRVSSLGERLYVHSAYPTLAENSVFFGPDSYRFAALITAELVKRPAVERARIVDVGTGTGVGAIVAGDICEGADIIMTDVNEEALRLARINAAAAGHAINAVATEGLEAIDCRFDVVMINPPYLIDADRRIYRDGGKMHGAQLSLDLSAAAMDRLAVGGRLILYTGSAIINGHDLFRHALETQAAERGLSLSYGEIDPDIFGEELEKPQYQSVERIAAIAAIVTRLW